MLSITDGSNPVPRGDIRCNGGGHEGDSDVHTEFHIVRSQVHRHAMLGCSRRVIANDCIDKYMDHRRVLSRLAEGSAKTITGTSPVSHFRISARHIVETETPRRGAIVLDQVE